MKDIGLPESDRVICSVVVKLPPRLSAGLLVKMFLALTFGVYGTNVMSAQPADPGATSIIDTLKKVLQRMTPNDAAGIRFGVVCALPIGLPPLIPSALGGPHAGPVPLMNPHCAAIGTTISWTETNEKRIADGPGPPSWLSIVPPMDERLTARPRPTSDEFPVARRRTSATSGASDDIPSKDSSSQERGSRTCSDRPCETQSTSLAANAVPEQDSSRFDQGGPGFDVHAWVPSLRMFVWAIIIGIIGAIFWFLQAKWFGARGTLLRAARSGLKHGEFYLEYQPVVNLRLGKCVGVEALLRWNNATFGALGPGHYMPHIERSNLIGPMTRFVLCKVAEEVGKLEAARSLYIGVNVPFSQLNLPSFVVDLQTTMPGCLRRLVIEVSQEDLPRATLKHLRAIAVLRKAGVRFALSGLNPTNGVGHLEGGWSFEMVKSEKPMLHLGENERSRLLSTMTNLTHNHHTVLVGEGVEISTHHDALVTARVELGQGFYYSRALSIGRLESFLARGGGATVLNWRIRGGRR
jgi:c-di-GMP phosphodiesterase